MLVENGEIILADGGGFVFKAMDLRKNQGGWILMDVLAGTVIVAVALTALLAMYTQAGKNTVANREYNNAVYVAQQSLEDLKQFNGTSTTRTDLKNETDARNAQSQAKPISADGVNYYVKYNGPLNIPSASPTAQIYPYRVTVSWTDNSVNPPAQGSIQAVAYYYGQ